MKTFAEWLAEKHGTTTEAITDTAQIAGFARRTLPGEVEDEDKKKKKGKKDGKNLS
jgi:hypothetical protein